MNFNYKALTSASSYRKSSVPSGLSHEQFPLMHVQSIHCPFTQSISNLNTWTQSYTSTNTAKCSYCTSETVCEFCLSITHQWLSFSAQTTCYQKHVFSMQGRQCAATPGCPDRQAGSWQGPRGGCRCPWWRASAAVLSASSPAWGDALPSGRYVAVQALVPAWCTQWPGKGKYFIFTVR